MRAHGPTRGTTSVRCLQSWVLNGRPSPAAQPEDTSAPTVVLPPSQPLSKEPLDYPPECFSKFYLGENPSGVLKVHCFMLPSAVLHPRPVNVEFRTRTQLLYNCAELGKCLQISMGDRSHPLFSTQTQASQAPYPEAQCAVGCRTAESKGSLCLWHTSNSFSSIRSSSIYCACGPSQPGHEAYQLHSTTIDRIQRAQPCS
jgi:hypothetical protein